MKQSLIEKRKLDSLIQMDKKLDAIMKHLGLTLPSDEPASPSTHVESEIVLPVVDDEPASVGKRRK